MYSDGIGVSCDIDQIQNLPAIDRSSLLNEPRISVVGGGFAGTGTILRLIESYHKSELDRAIKVMWYDCSGSFGRGLPYRDQGSDRANEVFILNQPASQMSLFAEHPNHFVEWLRARHEKYGKDSFVPRAIFGQYMEEQLTLAEWSLAGHGLEILKIKGEVSSATMAQAAKHQSSYVVDARGHKRSTQFDSLEHIPGYIGEPYRLSSYPTSVRGASEIALIGNGASAIDAIRACEFLGFKGSYLVMSGTLAFPWPYWPKAYSPETFGEYSPKLFNETNILEIINSGCDTYRNLCKLLNREIKHAIYDGFGPGHVYYSIDLENMVSLVNDIEANSQLITDINRFAKLVTFYRRAPTPPENMALLRELHVGHRLNPIKTRVAIDDISFDEINNVFEIKALEDGGARNRMAVGEHESWRADVLVNCAPFQGGESRGMRTSAQILDSTNRTTHFEVGSCAFSDSAFPRTWGVESFREELRSVASAIIESIASDLTT